ncbi:hypothetical protein [Kocuria atrinae]|nr:hypothetical protein [Kocuria atrinae]
MQREEFLEVGSGKLLEFGDSLCSERAVQRAPVPLISVSAVMGSD